MKYSPARTGVNLGFPTDLSDSLREGFGFPIMKACRNDNSRGHCSMSSSRNTHSNLGSSFSFRHEPCNAPFSSSCTGRRLACVCIEGFLDIDVGGCEESDCLLSSAIPSCHSLRVPAGFRPTLGGLCAICPSRAQSSSRAMTLVGFMNRP